MREMGLINSSQAAELQQERTIQRLTERVCILENEKKALEQVAFGARIPLLFQTKDRL